MLDSFNSDIIADFNDLKEQFALIQLFEKSIDQAVERAIKALHDKTIK